jgi:hypothetical protein
MGAARRRPAHRSALREPLGDDPVDRALDEAGRDALAGAVPLAVADDLAGAVSQAGGELLGRLAWPAELRLRLALRVSRNTPGVGGGSGFHGRVRHGARAPSGFGAVPGAAGHAPVPRITAIGAGAGHINPQAKMPATKPCRCAMPARGIQGPGGRGVKVYLDENGEKRLIGRAEVPEDCGPVFEVPLFGAASTIAERFAVGTVTRLPEGVGAPVVERAVLAGPGQLVDLLPGWEPLAS